LSSAKEVSAYILTLGEKEKLLIIGFLWSWWNARNKANVGDQRKSTDDIIFRARQITFSDARDTGQAGPNEKLPVWDAPPEGVWKINVDGGFCAESKKGA
jgi:hypothetical protein